MRVLAYVASSAALLGALLLGAALLLTGAHGNGAADNGFVWTTGNVDARDWSPQKPVLLNFTVGRTDGDIFRELNTEDIEASLDGKPLPLKPNSLIKGLDSEPTKTLFMIDCSGSMNAARGGGGVNKLSAAKESLHHFVGELDPYDKAAVYDFAATQRVAVALTNDRTELDRGIDSIVRCSGNDTNLYDSIKRAVNDAGANGVKVVVVLSDGMDDSVASRADWDAGRLRERKRGHEQELSDLARDKGVRVFAIALGQPLDERTLSMRPGSPETLNGVDFETLKNISERTNGGFATPIDIPKLNEATSGDQARRQERLTEELKDVLVEIKKASRFAYAQPVKLSDLEEGEGEVRLDVTVPRGDERVTHTLVYPYTWDKTAGSPEFKRGRSFINTKPHLGRSSLAQIYLVLLSPLALLALVPSVFGRIAAARELRRMGHAIEIVGRDSKLRGRLCPNEAGPGSQLYLFKEGDTVLVCPKCGTPHHLDCWEYNQHQCMNHVCEYSFVIPPRLKNK